MKKFYVFLAGAILFAGLFTAFWTLSVADASGANRFIVYQSNGDIFIRRSTDNGNTWKSPVNLSANPGLSHTPTLLVSGTNVYITWQQDNSAGTDTALYFRKSVNNGASWGTKIAIASGHGSDPRCASYPACAPVLAASGSNVYVAWTSVSQTDIDNDETYFRGSNNNGNTWNDLHSFGFSFSPDLSIAASGNSVFVLEGAKQINKSTDGGISWTLKSFSGTVNCPVEGTEFGEFDTCVAPIGL